MAKAYAQWARFAPIYDLVFGPALSQGRKDSIAAAERVGGRILEVGVGTGISLTDYSGKQPRRRRRLFRADAAQGAGAREASTSSSTSRRWR